MGGAKSKVQKKLEKLSTEISRAYPDLRVSQEGNEVIISGTLPVTANGFLLERYSARIDVPPGYPKTRPRVFETGGKLPKTSDHHFYPRAPSETEEEACVCLRDAWGWIADGFPTILAFIKGPVTDFFLWQACYDHFGEDKLGGWSHGVNGRL